jgi:hypothetical protein
MGVFARARIVPGQRTPRLGGRNTDRMLRIALCGRPLSRFPWPRSQREGCVFAWLLHRERIRVRVPERETAESQARMIEIQQLDRNDTWEFDLYHRSDPQSAHASHMLGLLSRFEEPEFARYCWQ